MSKKFFKLILFLILSICFAWFVLKKYSSPPSKQFSVGILKTATHPALDMVEKAFIETLKEKSNDSVSFIRTDGQGLIVNIHTIAQRFHASPPDLLCAIATPAAQSLISVEKEKPIVFAAVTDPSLLKLEDIKNVTGVADAYDIEGEIDAVSALLPSIKKVGIIFNPGEPSAVMQASTMKSSFQ